MRKQGFFYVDRELPWSPGIWIGRLCLSIGRDYSGKRFHAYVLWSHPREDDFLSLTLLRF